ncbi:hypothetical protein [uncultured Tenacibaculum sp.]|uniref:hypothetical protein n=1 Tax=uncultured Tenacibaculum sp. TaxID=174713 RepID=UPI0026376A31|nr:hypothetical protein [uncultured Tenacibaculum sp.]
MFIEEFERLKKKFDGKLNTEEITYTLDNGGKDFSTKLYLEIPYKDKKICIWNRTNPGVGRINVNFETQKESLEFHMHTRNHFVSLFLRGNRFKFSKTTPNISSFFRNSKSFRELKRIADKTAFEPTIFGKHKDNKYSLTIEYSLLFENKTKALEPIVLFCREFIDEFN